MPCSLAPKPVPVIVTETPGAALAGLTEIFGVTVKLTSGTMEATVEAPLASMVWAPEVAAGITMVALQLPWALAAGDAGVVVTCVPSKVTLILLSLAAKPAPVTVTEAPVAELPRLAERLGVTVKVAFPELEEVEPVAVMVWAPEAEAGMVITLFKPPVEFAVVFRSICVLTS